MCGIAGIIDKRDAAIDLTKIEHITDIVSHRGPDGKGYFVGSNFALGHRRLAILDLSDHGHQPMAYGDRYHITYNGEIYNYLELRAELEECGASFASNTDTEVILAAYAYWGAECCRRFNGMWAFALYDAQEHRIFFSRDRFGVKPLYLLDAPEQFAFGSEIKQLLLLQSTARANRKIVIESLLTSIDGHSDETFFKGIESFPQAHYGVYDLTTHVLTKTRYYEVRSDESQGGLSREDATARFRQLFEDSIRLRLRSDVRVGTCMSGGLDSSAIASVASRLHAAIENETFVGIHARSIDAEYDESMHAMRAAAALAVDLHVVAPTSTDFLSVIDEVAYAQEEPFGSPSMFMGWHVFRKAKELGCKVMLNGQGADEVLLGYERYFAAYLGSVSIWRFLQEMRAMSRNSKQTMKTILQYYFYFRLPALRVWWLKRRSFLRKELKDVHDFSTVRGSARSYRRIEELQVSEIASVQLPHLLRYEDRNSMAHSVETRLPFLDYRLVEFCLSVPPEYKIHEGWTKYLLRQSIATSLPAEITWRQDKLGFEAPVRSWLHAARTQMKERIATSPMLRQITDHERLLVAFDNLPAGEQWRYFMLAVWESVFGVQW